MSTVEERDQKRAAAEQRALALAGAAEIIAASPKVNAVVSLLELSGGCGRLVKAINRAKRSAAPKFVTVTNMAPDAGVWAQAAAAIIGSEG